MRSFTIMKKAPSRAFSWLKAPINTFKFDTPLIHYAKRMFSVIVESSWTFIVKLRERGGQMVDLGRSLKGHL